MKTKENSLVSVVLITYNSSKYVLDTLESVKNQTWDNIELIISDDGSTDNTTAICSNWLSENQNRFYNALLITVDENTGIPSNCNRGLRATKGEWLKTISGDFELDTMVKGPEALRTRIGAIKAQGNEATPKEKNLLTVLEVSLEMYERGFKFEKVDLYKSKASEFIVQENSLLPPFDVVDGLGTNAALKIVEAREDGEFLSKEDLRIRSKISKTVLEYLDNHGCLEGMQEENQLSLF